MTFLQHNIFWIKGEIFESKMIILFGITSTILGILSERIGTTPNSKALFLPFIFIGFIYAGIGGTMYFSNQKRLKEFPENFTENPTVFIKSEKKRVEDFQYQYKISKIVATICFITTIFIFWVTKNSTWQESGISLTLFGLIGLIIDYFSEERAGIYYQEILKFLT